MLSCPIKDKKWNDLVANVGELKAYMYYIENENNTPELKDLENIDIIADVNLESYAVFVQRIDELQNNARTNLIDFLSKYEHKYKGKETINELNKLLDNFNETSVKHNLLKATEFARIMVNYLDNYLVENKDDLDFLKQGEVILESIRGIINLSSDIESINTFLEKKNVIKTIAKTFEIENLKDNDPKDLKNKLNEVIKNSSFIKLSKDQKYYINTKTGQRYQRVTSFISDKEVKETDLLKSASVIGTKVDTLVRDFFDGTLKKYESYSLTSKEEFDKFLKQLKELKKKFDANGETVISKDITLFNDELQLAGTIDLLTYDKSGKVRIYDMKSMRGNQTNNKYSYDPDFIYDTKKYGKSNRQKHTEQLNIYKLLLQKTHNIKVNDLEIIPVEVSYEPKDEKTSKLELLDTIKLKNIDEVKGTTEVESKSNKIPTAFFEEEDIELIKKSKETFDRIEKELYNYSKENVIKTLALNSTYIYNKVREKADNEFKKQFPRSSSVDKESWDKQREKFIEEKLFKERNEIFFKEKERIRGLLTDKAIDISSLTASFYDPEIVRDHVVTIVNKMLVKVESKIEIEFNNKKVDFIKSIEGFYKEKPTSLLTNHKELYKGIYEEIDGKPTGYYVSKSLSTTQKEYEDVIKQIENLDLSEKEKEEIKNSFSNKYFKQDVLKSQFQLKPYFNPWDNSDYSNLELLLKDEFINPQFTQLMSSSLKSTWETLVKFNKESDKLLSKGLRLKTKIPRRESDLIRRTQEKGVQGALEVIKEDFGYSRTNEEKETTKGRSTVINRIALPFRNDLPIEDMDYDLGSLALLNRKASLNYHHKRQILPTLEITKTLMAKRDVKISSGGNIKSEIIRRLSSGEEEIRELTIKGTTSKSYELYNSIIESRLYGYNMIDGGTLLGLDVNKLSAKINSFAANNALAWNIVGGVSNALQGQVQNYLLAMGGRYFSKKNLNVGIKTYLADSSNIIADYGNNYNKSETNLLMERFFGTSADFNSFSSAILSDARFKEIFSNRTKHFPNSTAEHFIQGAILYAVLDNLKEKGIDYKDFYSFEDGKIIYKTVKNKTLKEEELILKMRSILTRIQGNYSSVTKSQIERYWYGKLLTTFRKYMIRGIHSRYAGITTVNKTFQENLDEDKIAFNENLGEFKEGSYTSFIRFINLNIIKADTLNMELISKNWDELSEEERANIKQTVAELCLIALCLLSTYLLANLAKELDDEEQTTVYYMAYFFRRLASDYLFYIPVVNAGEILRTMKTPASALNTVELIRKTFLQFAQDGLSLELEEFKTGRRKGQSKSLHYSMQLMFPEYKNVYDKDIKDMFKFINQ